MLPSDDILTDVTRTVFETMLGLDVTGPTDTFSFSGGWELAIDISGQWNGAIILVVPDDLARAAASALLGCDQATLEPADLHDALAEVANMIGGNVKSIIPGPNELSLPRRQLGSKLGANGSRSLCFESGGIPFIVRVQPHASAA